MKNIGWFDLRENSTGILSSTMASDTAVINGVGGESLGPQIQGGLFVHPFRSCYWFLQLLVGVTTNDFLILSKDGINMLALGEKMERVVKDEDGF
jgi:hypothetical protein